MTFPRLVAVMVLFLALASSAAPPPGYYLVWGDEFNGSSLDPAKWWVWNQPDRSGYTVPDAVTIANGCLTITTYSTNQLNYSAIVSSDGRFRARYGYTEASVEFNGSPGMFSDFWLISPISGEIIGDPAEEGTEIDVCEHRVTDANNVDNINDMVTIDLHWNGSTNTMTGTSGLVGSGLGTGFHTYGLLWSSTNYTVNIDGAQMWSTNGGISQRTQEVMLSCEVDSNSFCGIVPSNGYGNFLASATTTVVDYVRFYAPTTTLYWTGGSSADWGDGGNWLSNMIPTSAVDAVFNYFSEVNFNINLGQTTTVNSLSIQETPAISLNGNALIVNSGGIDMVSAINNATINSTVVLNTAQPWSIGPNLILVVAGAVGGAGNLTLTGRGTVVLEGTNNCSGLMTVSKGALLVNGLITNAVTVAGGTLGGTGLLTGPIIVNSGTLGGTEIITAPVIINAKGTLAPGSSASALAISNTLALQPGSVTSVNLNASTGAASLVNGLASVTYGGTLVINNEAGTLAAGQSFKIFDAKNYAGTFSRISPATPGGGLAWDTTDLYSQGVLRVITMSSSLITSRMSGRQLSLSWPSNNTGWILQSQTNAVGTGLTTHWTTIPGSSGTNLMSLTMDPSIGSVFFRLAEPSFSTALFGVGDLVVLQVGNGNIAASGAPGVLNDYSPFGGASQFQISLPSTGSNAIIFGSSSYDGALSLSADGRTLLVAGYNVALGAFSGTLDSSSTSGATPVLRAAGSLDATGNFTFNAATKQFSGGTIRCAAADGIGNFWACGGSSGIIYMGSNSPAAVISTVSPAARDLAFVNGNIYFTETGSGIGVMAFSGAPKTASTPSLILNTANTGTGTASPKGFAFNPAVTIAYIVDNRTASTGGGIQRFNWSGSAWVYAYTMGNTLTSSKEVDDLAVDFSGTNPVIYAITGEATGNHLVTVTDTGANSPFSSLETAPSGDAFRGIAFAPTQD